MLVASPVELTLYLPNLLMQKFFELGLSKLSLLIAQFVELKLS